MEKKSATSLVLALVMSYLDYYNSLLLDETQGLLQWFEQVQNTTARIVKCPPNHTHRTPIHWLPINQHAMFTTLCHLFKSVNGLAPLYQIEVLKVISLREISDL